MPMIVDGVYPRIIRSIIINAVAATSVGVAYRFIYGMEKDPTYVILIFFYIFCVFVCFNLLLESRKIGALYAAISIFTGVVAWFSAGAISGWSNPLR